MVRKVGLLPKPCFWQVHARARQRCDSYFDTYLPELDPPGSPGYGPGGTASASASASDAVTVNSPGRAGQVGKMIVVLELEGFVDTLGSAYASASARAEFGYGTSRGLGFSWVAEDSTVATDFVGVTVTLPGTLPILYRGSPYARFVESFPIVIGEQGFFSFGMQGRAATAVDVPRSSGQAAFDLGRSFTWGGFQGVEIDGVLVPFTVASASGFNWASPVPEAGTGWTLLLGLASLGFLRRGVKRRQ